MGRLHLTLSLYQAPRQWVETIQEHARPGCQNCYVIGVGKRTGVARRGWFGSPTDLSTPRTGEGIQPQLY
jgi:hypothetical protein